MPSHIYFLNSSLNDVRFEVGERNMERAGGLHNALDLPSFSSLVSAAILRRNLIPKAVEKITWGGQVRKKVLHLTPCSETT